MGEGQDGFAFVRQHRRQRIDDPPDRPRVTGQTIAQVPSTGMLPETISANLTAFEPITRTGRWLRPDACHPEAFCEAFANVYRAAWGDWQNPWG